MQRASWPEVCRCINGISDDFHGLGTSVEKLSHFFDHRYLISDVGQFAVTELEYIFILSRSVFDLLHELIVWVWTNTVRLLDDAAEARRKRQKIPDKFSKLVLSGDQIRSAQELIDRYVLPPILANTYVDVASFFVDLRRFRDEIVHLGKTPRMLFVTEQGFCVTKSAYGFGAASFWRPEHQGDNDLVSLLPLLAHVVLGTIQACGALMQALAQEIALPPPIAPEYRVFVRGPHNEALIWLLDVASGASPWWSARAAWKHARIERRAHFLWEQRVGKQWWDPLSNWLEAERDLTPVDQRMRSQRPEIRV